MGLILARSPFFVDRNGFDAGATLKVEMGYVVAGLTITKTYNLNFNESNRLDISPLVREQIGVVWSEATAGVPSSETRAEFVGVVRTTLSGEIAEVPQSDVILSYISTDGYSFYEDGYNANLIADLEDNAYYAGSNDRIQKLDDSPLIIPFLIAADADYLSNTDVIEHVITFYNKGVQVYQDTNSKNIGLTSPSNFFQVGDYFKSYKNRVVADSGTFEDSNCLQDFFDQFQLQPIDKVLISAENTSSGDTYIKELKVETIEECKHTPDRLIFLNKYGVEEDLWFFKKSEKSMSSEKESFRASTIISYASTSTSKTDLHAYQDYNINGRESLTLNTGFVHESFYNNFKQLMLSEKVYVYLNDKQYPINIKTSELTEKTHVNEKLINYTIEVEFSYDVINNIV